MLKKHILTLALISALWVPKLSYATPGEEDRQQFEIMRNIISNPGFESGKQDWTPSAAAELTLETSAPGYGNRSGIWDATSNGGTLDSDLIAIPAAMFGRRCVAEMNYKWTAGTKGHITFKVHDGTSDVATSEVQVAAVWQIHRMKFNCPASGSLRIRFLSNSASTAAITLDNLSIRLELDDYASQVATFTYPTTAGCDTWSSTSATPVALAADTGCPSPTITFDSGVARPDNSGNGLPQAKLYDLPEGLYRVEVTGIATSSGVTSYPCLAVSDGTTTLGRACGTATSSTQFPFIVSGDFVYTSAQSSKTFSLFGSIDATTLNVVADSLNRQLIFKIYRFPRPR